MLTNGPIVVVRFRIPYIEELPEEKKITETDDKSYVDHGNKTVYHTASGISVRNDLFLERNSPHLVTATTPLIMSSDTATLAHWATPSPPLIMCSRIC